MRGPQARLARLEAENKELSRRLQEALGVASHTGQMAFKSDATADAGYGVHDGRNTATSVNTQVGGETSVNVRWVVKRL